MGIFSMLGPLLGMAASASPLGPVGGLAVNGLVGGLASQENEQAKERQRKQALELEAEQSRYGWTKSGVPITRYGGWQGGTSGAENLTGVTAGLMSGQKNIDAKDAADLTKAKTLYTQAATQALGTQKPAAPEKSLEEMMNLQNNPRVGPPVELQGNSPTAFQDLLKRLMESKYGQRSQA